MALDFHEVWSLRKRPRPTGWTVGALAELRALMQDLDGDLVEVARAMGENQRECDLALDALVGRTPAQALERLEARARFTPSESQA